MVFTGTGDLSNGLMPDPFAGQVVCLVSHKGPSAVALMHGILSRAPSHDLLIDLPVMAGPLDFLF